MYINYKLAESRGLDKEHISLMIMAKQNRNEDMSDIIEKYYKEDSLVLKDLLDKDLIGSIDGKPSQTVYEKLRLTKKGQTYIDDFETPVVTEEDIQVFNWAESIYKSKGKQIGNKKKTKLYIACFRIQSGIEKNDLAKLLKTFFTDENNMEYNYVLEFAFFKGTTYQVRFDIQQSRLYQYYLSNQNYFDKIFKN